MPVSSCPTSTLLHARIRLVSVPSSGLGTRCQVISGVCCAMFMSGSFRAPLRLPGPGGAFVCPPRRGCRGERDTGCIDLVGGVPHHPRSLLPLRNQHVEIDHVEEE